ncbi:FAD-dependent oxidoreductase [Limnoglobus roseus]|uniref:FAD-dependent oxidoreductase n=1 Tax=Limnoglobus roseus TaxID=2598579 RepID=A0A5C1A9R8_9BACT|nr:FAD-dependent oxidoreductase [Limnoglobus roseus]QEL14967.1 FAD-dependent oxidoreductase [Limnoglobus roseus]
MFRLSALLALILAPALPAADVVVYGGTSGGVAAAIQAARMGKSVVLIEPTDHVGGLTTGGLGYTDSGTKGVVGGISREFYQRVKKYYDDPKVWKYGDRSKYASYRKDEDAMWTFEPATAEMILRQMLDEAKVPVTFKERLDRGGKGVKLDGKAITSITTESGKSYDGKVFIDATYEGDLMAAAGVSFAVGREAVKQYGESLNGIARKWNQHTHRFLMKVDPYVKPGDPASGLLFGIDPKLGTDGEADQRLQAYCFRMCMSNVAENRVPFQKPEGYDEKMYELLLRNYEAGDKRLPLKLDMMPNGKTDTNNNFAVSTDFIGQNYKYPEASYAEREKIIHEHEVYQKGLMWTLANHPRVPQSIRDSMAVWGLPKDEFVTTGGWPHQIYVREARRMVGDYVHTEADCRRSRPTPMSVGMGSYNMDSHNCARYVTPEGFVQNEGDVQVSPGGPYQISYGSIVPKAAECPNLLVPVCVSSSHIAYGSIRMEPVFMVLGQSAATAAVFAIDDAVPVQKVAYEKLQKRMLADKQVLDYSRPANPQAVDATKLGGIVVDDDKAKATGEWTPSSSTAGFVGHGYLHDNNADKGKKTVRYTPKLEKAGKYEVFLHYSATSNRATNVPVVVNSADGEKTVKVDQRKAAEKGKSLGVFRFAAGEAGWVEVRTDGTDGHVIADAVRFVAKE